jgi:hypothetical protein
MATAAVTDNPRQLPLFEGWRVEEGAITFAGAVSFGLATAEDRALIEALSLGKKVTLRLEVGGREVVFDGRVGQRVFGLRFDKETESDVPFTRCQVKVLDDKGER